MARRRRGERNFGEILREALLFHEHLAHGDRTPWLQHMRRGRKSGWELLGATGNDWVGAISSVVAGIGRSSRFQSLQSRSPLLPLQSRRQTFFMSRKNHKAIQYNKP
jgi:hypothetical protein